MSVAHGVNSIGVVGAGQMGLGIAYVAAVRAKVPHVSICDASGAQLAKSVSFFEELLAKDVAKGRLDAADAQDARRCLRPIGGSLSKFIHAKPDMVVEVRLSPNANGLFEGDGLPK